MASVPTSPTTLLATIGDPDGTRTVTSIVGLLVAIGLALVMVAVWLHRSTRPDPELLAPLEAMGERRWRRADPVAQRRTLDELRPAGAEPLAPSVAPPDIDEAFEAGPTATGFEDLHGDDAPDAADAANEPEPARSPVVPPTGEVTPRQIDRPGFNEFDHEIDPQVLAAAAADLEAELDRKQVAEREREAELERDAEGDRDVELERDAELQREPDTD